MLPVGGWLAAEPVVLDALALLEELADVVVALDDVDVLDEPVVVELDAPSG
jgi:hypothetical protein